MTADSPSPSLSTSAAAPPRMSEKPEPAAPMPTTTPNTAPQRPDTVAETKAGVPLDPPGVWAAVCASVASSPAGAALVESLRLVSLEHGVATVETDDAGAAGRARTRRKWLEERIGAAYGSPVRVEVHAPEEGAATQAIPDEELDAAARRDAANNPLVQKAMDLFQARLVRVDPPETPSKARGK